MSKKITIGTALLVVLLAILVTFNITYLSVNNKYSDKLAEVMASYDAYNKLSGVMQLVDENYIGEVNGDSVADSILAGYISGIGDKYARYLNAEDYAAFVAKQNASSVGIGVLAEYDSERRGILLVYIMPDSPAQSAGLEAGDLIVSIGETAVSEITYEEATALLKGEEGTSVSVSIIRDDTRQLDFSLVRKAVALLSVTYHMCTDAQGAQTDIGYIHISGFDSQTPAQFQAAVTDLQLQGAKKFIFDVRGNPGGEFNSVVKVMDSLLPEGPLVRIYDKDGTETTTNSDANEMKVPVCVLVDGKTASAGELFTAALMDYTDKGLYDATVIGSVTYGKGTVQSVFRLSDNTAISITTKTYNPPYSDNYEGKGLTPDVELALDAEAAKTSIYLRADRDDNQIQRAVEILNEK